MWEKCLTGNLPDHNAAERTSINKESVDSEVDEGETRASCSAWWQGPGKRPDPPPEFQTTSSLNSKRFDVLGFNLLIDAIKSSSDVRHMTSAQSVD